MRRLLRFSTTLTRRQAVPLSVTVLRKPLWLNDETVQNKERNGLGVRPWANNRAFPEGPPDPPDPILPPGTTGTFADWALTQNTGIEVRSTAFGFTGNVVNYSLVSPLAGVTIDANTGILTADTSVVAVGTNAITVRAANVAGNVTQTLNVVMSAVLQPPVRINFLSDWSVTQGTTNNTFLTSVAFSGDGLAYTIQGASIAGLTINSVTGRLTADSNVVPLGANTFTVRATNAAGFAEDTMVLNIVSLLPPPVAVGTLAPWALTQNTGIQTFNTAVGFSGVITSYAQITPLAGLSMSTLTGVVSIDTAVMALGTAGRTIKAQNASGFATQTLNWTLSAALQAPVAVGTIAAWNVTQGTSGNTRSVVSNFSGSQLTYSIFSGGTAGLSINGVTGILTADSNTIAAGSYPLVIRATNPAGFAAQSFTLTLVVALAPPVKVGQLANWTELQNTGSKTYAAVSGFSGSGITYSLVSPPTGVTIVGSTGVVTCNTATTPLGAVSLTIRATNASGFVDQTITLTITQAALPKAVQLNDIDIDMIGTIYHPDFPAPDNRQTGVVAIPVNSLAFNSTILKWGNSFDVPMPLTYIGLMDGGAKLYRCESTTGQHMKNPTEYYGGIRIYHQTPATTLSDPSTASLRFTVPSSADLPILAKFKPA